MSELLMNILLVAALVAIWLAFAPVKLGGQVSYVMVNGISMEPGFHKGDLVIVRRAADYQVGDVVTYRDAEMEANVIHRIIGTVENRFVLQGDNNSWIDAYEPTSVEILGKLWLHLPKLARAIEWVRSPLNTALTAGLLAGIFSLDWAKKKTNRRGKKKHSGGLSGGPFEIALYGAGILALAFLGLTIFSFSRPVLRAADKVTYEHSGEFFYSASGDPTVYDKDAVRSGEPLFTQLTCTLNLGFIYALQGEELENISGVQKFYAMIVDEQSGWKRTIPLTSDTSFNGALYTSSATLDLCQVQAVLAAVEQKTGYRQSTHILVIAAPVLVKGTISGQAFSDTFEPQLTFAFDSLRFYLSGNSSQADPMQTVKSGTLSNPGMVANTFKLLGVKPTVKGIRIAAVSGLVLSLGGLLALGFYFYRTSKNNPEVIIRMKYGSILMDVYDHGLKDRSPVIEVTSMENLAKLAERQTVMILHLLCDYAHYYFIQSEGITYRFVSNKERTAEAD